MNRWFDKLPIMGGKITLSFLMFLFSLILGIIFKTVDRTICIFAMFFSFIGDIALNHKRNHDDQSKKDFIIGGIFFILAHISYCFAYYKKISINQYSLFNLGSLLAIIILIFITIFMLKMSHSENYSKLFLFGIAYLWITGINYITIFSYAFSEKDICKFAALGGLMFLSSDVIIGLEKFNGLKSKIAREFVWWLYPIGQILLIAMA